MNPSSVLLFSGKRKSGKDYLTDKIHERLGVQNVAMIKISAPIKTHWAEKHHLNFEELMSAGEYKEKHRQDMIKWSEEIRNNNYGYFCEAAVKMFKAHEKPIWIVSDIRRKTDLKWFRENYGSAVKTVRVVADDDVRRQRGWVFTTGIDDAETECNLDEETEWDWKIVNNDNEAETELGMLSILTWVGSISCAQDVS
ncbi:phosphomevalonate kinase isoform X1 [Periplaneta americana]|uniref:phosphomevalonate kinase isoform X1 n=2 Tax=Periplaneta americana TaxID=6978 RepID=UPI0037E8662B